MLYLFTFGAAEALLRVLCALNIDAFLVEGGIFKPYGRGVIIIIEESIKIAVRFLETVAFF